MNTRRVAALLRELADELEQTAAPTDWVPHTAWPVKSVRVACELARSGTIPARRAGKLWLARRADLDAWVERQKTAPAPKPSNDQEDPIAMMIDIATRRRIA